MRKWLVMFGIVSPTDSWTDVVFGLMMVWTVVGLLGMALGLHVGWWDIFGLMPKNPRYAY